jgi:acyl-CoA thioesterase II
VFIVQTVAQALVASCRTVDPAFVVHSLHSYFLRPGNDDLPIMYYVERLREGRSFATRRVTALQKGKAIFAMMVSFMTLEEGREHQDKMPNVPPPEEIKSLMETYQDMLKDPRLTPRIRKGLERSVSLPFPVDLRRVEPKNLAERLKKGPAVQRSWMKVSGQMSDSLMLHQCALAYMSDWSLLETALLPHALHGWISNDEETSLQMASIDHSMWFHHSFRSDEWLLYDMESPSASGGRGFAIGRFFNREGKLIVSTAQEGLIRVHKGPPPPIKPVGSEAYSAKSRSHSQRTAALSKKATSDVLVETRKSKL